MVQIKSDYTWADTPVWTPVLQLHYLSMSVECSHETRNPHTHCTQTIPHGMNNMKVFHKIHMPRFEPPNTCFDTWYPLLQYQHWLQLLKLFVRFTVSSRFDHQTRTVASAPSSVDSLGVATGRPNGPYRHARRRQRRSYGATRYIVHGILG